MKTKLKKLIHKIVKRPLNAFGLDIVRQTTARTWKKRMQLAKKLGFSPKVVIDGGAFTGLWSKEIAELFPGIQIIIVEPNSSVQKIIAHNTSHIRPAPIILNVALGEYQRKASFHIWRDEDSDTGASLLNHVSGKAKREIQVEVDTLDNIAQRLDIRPDLIKLDLQGGESAALKGGEKVLKEAEFAIIEFGCLEAYIARATPRDILDIMYDNNYVLYDIVDCHDRPYDGALTGGDFFFVKNSSVLRHYKGWE